MKAAVMRGGELVVDEVPDPEPELGQILVRTLACGICGSDLHFLRHGSALVELSGRLRPSFAGLEPPTPDLGRDIVMGHEFCCEVLEVGPDTVGPSPGALVVSMPVMVTAMGLDSLAYSNRFPGGYAERMLLSAPLALEVPAGVGARRAALTEPLAVGMHAVEKAAIGPGEAAVVIGCGPVGLSVIASLEDRGIEPIVAADPSSARRRLAEVMGADDVVDPRQEPPVEAWRRVDGRRPLVIFEAVGTPGMIDAILCDAPPAARIVVVGVCMEPDGLHPFFGVSKELSLQFVLGYTPTEFQDSLRAIAEGRIDVDPLITGSVAIEGIPDAFVELGDPDRHAKILVEPA